MKNTIEELSRILDLVPLKISQLDEAEFSAKPLPHKWSKKEILGHLIDSAHNNLRRFIAAQYEKTPPKITYDQDFWVSTNGYQHMKTQDLIHLWVLINRRVESVLSTMPVEHYKRNCDTGKTNEDLRSLEWLANDYVQHMKHHLNQVLQSSIPL